MSQFMLIMSLQFLGLYATATVAGYVSVRVSERKKGV